MIFIRALGASAIKFAELLGGFAYFCFNLTIMAFLRPFYFTSICSQLLFMGFYSLPVVSMTALFSGAVLALQTYSGFDYSNAEVSIPLVVGLSITRELGPVLAGLMVTGRVGASIAAEIATMRVTEQIDALQTLRVNPIKYLITPRVVAAIISMPLLVLVADVIGIYGGYATCVYKLGLNGSAYLNGIFTYVSYWDVTSGTIKAAFFGMLMSIISCFAGYNAERGAKGVGKATTDAVVFSSIAVLASNYFITQVLLG